MEKIEVLNILAEIRDQEQRHYIFCQKESLRRREYGAKNLYDLKKEEEESYFYVRDLVIFFKNEEVDYEKYKESIDKFHNEYLSKLHLPKQELEEKLLRLEKLKNYIIDTLSLEEIKNKNLINIQNFLNKQINTNIENEELKRATALILTYIDYSKKEIINEIKNYRRHYREN